MDKYIIAGICLKGEGLPDSYRVFRDDSGGEACIIIKKTEELDAGTISEKYEQQIVETYKEEQFRVHRLQDGHWLFRSLLDPAIVELLASSDFCRMEYCLPKVSSASKIFQKIRIEFFLRIALESFLIRKGRISVHAACIEYNSSAVAFSAPSGVGKSTRASQWVDFFDARWISGDRPVIYPVNGKIVASGVPWDGKEQIFRQTEVPLKAILEVRRSEHTYIRRLTTRQAERLLAAQSFIPLWDTQTAALALYRIRRLAQEAPVYRAFCGYDKEAAEELRRILFEHPEEIREELPDMKIKKDFALTDIGGEYMVMPTGENVKKFGGAVVLNEVAAFIYKQMEHEISKEDLLEQILDQYEIDQETAERDLGKILATFESYDMIDKD